MARVGKILNKNSKVVLITWLCMIFVIVQIFTATLSSWLTIDQMRPRLPSSFKNVGYQYGSYLNDYIPQKYNCSDNNLVPLKSIEEFKDALFNGSVNAVFDELPYVELFLAKYGSSYMKFGPINQESGLAFRLCLSKTTVAQLALVMTTSIFFTVVDDATNGNECISSQS
ncbi:hypothetical protein L1987_01670 [Smallanthus sonchifolius]|uniref:Uncharacterized protein n=1 Tax=Smallanthus sonchifolius TaxID=185202 RepID=A0ACB9K5R1_9ASTR|nr:hypothetical protein L1987_01670 [Smallanthus sonchifolius]